MSAETSGSRNPLEILAEEFAERLRRGERPTIEEYAERYPHQAVALRRVLEPLLLLERAGAQEVAPSEPVRIAGYRVLREIGRGGMGVVYEAEQLSLSRRVALKVLTTAGNGSPAHRERFRREAEAAARLHHTNIVPVFGAGEDGGRDYYVMQLIEGESLREILGAMHAMKLGRGHVGRPSAEWAAALLLKRSEPERPDGAPDCDLPAGRPEYFRRVAKLGISVARALSHSHQRGILHRDIKPSNIMLDRAGAVWVTDFGLAKLLDREDLTATGDVVGTVRYMAPEQFHGRVDARSDVHSLGLLLHELLTLTPAYPEKQHARLMQSKLKSPPPAPRTLVPGIPRDLETIVRKACALEPRHRYQRASDLEADLRGFLEDRPISARRPRAPEQLWRWARRNPVAAVLGSATAALLMLAVLVFAIAGSRTRRALNLVAEEKGRVEEALRQVEEEREKAVAAAALAQSEEARATENLAVALEAFDRILENLSSRGAPGSLDLLLDREVSGVNPADVELLEALLAFFERFADRNRVDLRAESAAARRQVGDIQRRLGRLTEAVTSYRQALSAYRELAAGSGDPVLVLEQARILHAIATTESHAGVIREAFGTYREARGLLRESPHAESAEFRFELARGLVLAATVAERTGMSPGESLADGARGGDSGSGQPGRGGRRGTGGRTPRRDSSQEAVEILTALLRETPDDPDCRFLLVRAHRARVLAAKREEDLDAAETALDSAIAGAEGLVRDFPEVPAFEFELAELLATEIGGGSGYGARMDRAVETCMRLLAAHPEMPEFQSLAGSCLAGKARLLAEAGELERAAAEYERALNHLRPGADRSPGVLSLQSACARTLAELAEVKARQQEDEAALALLDEAIRRAEAFRDRRTTARPALAALLAELRRKRDSLRDR
ncbi:MAG: serine/threonine protein kinase [Planctomycetes bacterium]|nr:serine/threonine protein kinase [Planctomycetota bacterium]